VKASELAQVTAEQAIADALAAADPLREANARSVLGVILADRGCTREARRSFRTAALRYREIGDELRLKKASSNIGHTYRAQGNVESIGGKPALAAMRWKQARRVYQAALRTRTTEADDAILLGSMAECDYRLGELGAARDHVEQALALAVQAPMIEAPCHLCLARIFHAQGDLKAAERACERARDSALRLEHGDVLATCLQLQSQLNDLQGRFETAQDFERRSREVTLEREAELGRMRDELAMVWERYAMPVPPVRDGNPRAA